MIATEYLMKFFDKHGEKYDIREENYKIKMEVYGNFRIVYVFSDDMETRMINDVDGKICIEYSELGNLIVISDCDRFNLEVRGINEMSVYASTDGIVFYDSKKSVGIYTYRKV